MTSQMPGLVLPAYFSYYKSPVKMVETEEGGIRAWRLSHRTGGWEPADDLIEEILFAIGGEISTLTVESFIQWTEHDRARYLRGDGPVFALYETIEGILDDAEREQRSLTDIELAMIRGIRRRTYVMFEEQLQRDGDPAADPSLAEQAET